MECIPTLSAVVVIFDWLLVTLLLPMIVLPSLNCTVPPGIPLLVLVKVAVNVTGSPKFDGLDDEVRVI